MPWMMSRRVRRSALICITALAAALGAPEHGAAQERSLLSGVLTSSLDLLSSRGLAGQDDGFHYGWSNLANMRYRSRVNESLSFFISANLFGSNGYYLDLTGAPVRAELERLYLTAGGERVSVDAGLIRITHGYGYLFSPLDILSPRDLTNSLDPQARPPGRWGVHAAFYPREMWRVEAFALAPDNPFQSVGWGSRFGGATTLSIGKVNLDAMAVLLLPEIAYRSDPLVLGLDPSTNNDFTELVGVGLKVDVEVGLYFETLYRFENQAFRTGTFSGTSFDWHKGLAAAAGLDYTLPGSGIYLLAEYLFSGSTAVSPPLAHRDYLFVIARYPAATDLSLGLSCLGGLDDLSALFTAFCEYEIVQGLTLQAALLLPIDRGILDAGAACGEWGSTSLAFRRMFRLGAKMRF